MKLLVLIFSCKKYLSRVKNLKRIGYLDAFRKTNQDYLIVVGDDKMDDEYVLKNNTLTVKADDSYEGFPKKVIKTFYLIKELYNYDYIIKSDDDCLLNLYQLKKSHDYLKKHNYIGRIGNYEYQYNPNYGGLNNRSEYLGPYMNGATGYVLSKRALNTIYNFKEQIDKMLLNELFEDKLIGDIMRINGYKIAKHEMWASRLVNIDDVKSYDRHVRRKQKLRSGYTCMSFFQNQVG